MTAATLSASLSPSLKRRDRIGLPDLAWLIWRQHRMLITVATLAVLAMAGLLWWDAADVSHASAYPLLTTVALPATAGLLAVFLGAPQLPVEYERGTHFVVWSQDVSPTRWLAARIVFLGAWLAVLMAILGVADTTFVRAISRVQYVPQQYGHWGSTGFESWIPLQIVYALFGFALGLAVGALARRLVVSMAVTMFVFAAVRVAIGLYRPTFLTPLRYTVPATPLAFDPPGVGSLKIGFEHTVDAAGNDIPFPGSCVSYPSDPTADPTINAGCVSRHGAVSSYVEYQPASRLATFHWIEFGIYAVLTVALLALTVTTVRRIRAR